jgi:hypothetical protein
MYPQEWKSGGGGAEKVGAEVACSKNARIG